ncbi:MAG: hypothetical protein OXI58_08450 [Gemmatimonadota bacterium]|nr:hypothetical protein [Gemmatimonadota bacterium]
MSEADVAVGFHAGAHVGLTFVRFAQHDKEISAVGCDVVNMVQRMNDSIKRGRVQ